MTVEPGTKLGHYEILSSIGSGGMGEVFRARDLKLGREVAIKTLPEKFAADKVRLSRFEREARLLASISHPGVATIYDFEQVDGVRFLSMELVEGETLRERLKRGPLPVKEALPVLLQIAEALEAAHAMGVVHRDLKPANIMLAGNGRVKLLDFGLAKAIAAPPLSELSESPTTTRETAYGLVLGTAPYMSPEQARGETIDERTDIWAFGCVAFEMLSGKPAFLGKTIPDTVAKILERDPDWSAIRHSIPPGLIRLLESSLRKEAVERPSRFTDLIEAIRRSQSVPRFAWFSPARRVGGVAIGLTAIVVLAWFVLRPASERLHFSNARQLSSDIGSLDVPNWSPDGRMLAYQSNSDGDWDIWIMQADGSNSLNRTKDHDGEDGFPVWSPDGTQIAFYSDRDGGGIFVMQPLAGVPRRHSRKGSLARGRPQWSQDQRRLAYEVRDGGTSFAEIMELSSGESTRVILPGERLARPDLSWSQDGRFFAYLDADERGNSFNRLMILRVEDGAVVTVTGDLSQEFSPQWAADSRRLFFTSNRREVADLWVQPIRRDGGMDGEAVPLTTGLLVRSAALSPDATRVAYARGRSVSNIWRVPILAGIPATWAEAEQLTFDHSVYATPDVSADGSQLVVGSTRSGSFDLWVVPVDGGDMYQITDDEYGEGFPKWSPDGTAVAYHSIRHGTRDIYVKPLGGGPTTRLTGDEGEEYLPSWSPDGEEIVFASTRSGILDIWSVASAGGEPTQLTAGGYHHPSWSPDGSQLAFHSHQQPTQGERIWLLRRSETQLEPLTTGSGVGPIWSPDGAFVYFTGVDDRGGDIWAVELASRVERRLTRFQGRPGGLRRYGLATDGRYIYFTWVDQQSDIWIMDVETN